MKRGQRDLHGTTSSSDKNSYRRIERKYLSSSRSGSLITRLLQHSPDTFRNFWQRSCAFRFINYSASTSDEAGWLSPYLPFALFLSFNVTSNTPRADEYSSSPRSSTSNTLSHCARTLFTAYTIYRRWRYRHPIAWTLLLSISFSLIDAKSDAEGIIRVYEDNAKAEEKWWASRAGVNGVRNRLLEISTSSFLISKDSVYETFAKL